MAGIGFELKKIFKERGIISMLKGVAYSTFTIIGPMLIIMLGFLLLNIVTRTPVMDYYQKDLFASIILYVFIFSLILTTPLAAVISRYIADKIFEKNVSDILACYNIGLLINVIIGAAFAVPFIAYIVINDLVGLNIMMVSGCAFFALLFVFYNMTFISALKKYKLISLTFLGGMAAALGLAWLLFKILQMQFLISVLLAIAAGFMFIGAMLFALISNYFKTNSQNYKEIFSYLWRYKPLFFANLFYILGLYVHNFVYWYFPPLSVTVAGVFRSAPVYDSATFLAMLTNISVTVIFTVRVEINFHSKYKEYCQEILGGTGANITDAKNNMFLTLVKELFHIVQLQAIIAIILYLIFMTFATFFGFGGLAIEIYPSLAAGYFLIFIMYCMIIFLFYFDDRIGACVAAAIFFAVTFAVSAFSTRLNVNLYGIGPFFGAFCSFTMSYFRLKYIEKNIDRIMFCRGNIVRNVSLKPVRRAGHAKPEAAPGKHKNNH